MARPPAISGFAFPAIDFVVTYPDQARYSAFVRAGLRSGFCGNPLCSAQDADRATIRLSGSSSTNLLISFFRAPAV